MALQSHNSRPEPSVGSAAAEVGTKEWADRVRLDLQAIVANITQESELATKYFRKIFEHRAWTLMMKQDGTFFASVDELCSVPRPWGLGRPWGEIKPYLEAELRKQGVDPVRALQLETVPEAQKPPPGPGRGHKSDESKTTYRDDKEFSGPTAARLRAITRAPDVVKDAYREGRISQDLAAKLGPKNPTPERAAQVAEIAGEIRKAKTREQVDEIVRERLGIRSPTVVDRALALVERMTAQERVDFAKRIESLVLDAQAQLMTGMQ